MAMNTTSQEPMEHKLKLIFKMFDIRGNGLLTKEDLARAFDAINTSYGYGMKINSWEKAVSILDKVTDSVETGSLGEKTFIASCLEDPFLCQVMSNFKLDK